MKSSKTLKLGAVSLAVLLSTSAHAISFDELFFDQKAGFDAASLMINVNNPDLVVEFENELSPNGMDPGDFPTGTGDGLFDTMTWEGTDDPGDPSMLNIQSFTDDTSPTSDGAWGANEWWTITRLTATNNVIFDLAWNSGKSTSWPTSGSSADPPQYGQRGATGYQQRQLVDL